MIKKSIMFFCLALLVCATPAGQAAYSQSLEDAIRNYQSGKYKKAERQWQNLAEAGNADALFNLGQMYHLGKKTAFDDNKAADYYLAAANLGHTAAARELGNLYFFSPGVNGGKEAAASWWLRAAEAGDGQAQYILGIVYFNGDGVNQDLTLGFAWTLLAVDAGVLEAIQLETAMRGQLTEAELAKSLELAPTLMTGTPNQARAHLLINEMVQQPRKFSVRTDIALPELEVKEPVPIRLEDQPVLELVELEPQEELAAEATLIETIQADPQEDALPEAAVNDQTGPGPPLQPVPELSGQGAEILIPETIEDEALGEHADGFSETREALNDLIEETAPATPEIIPADSYDLGDPLSPLVSENNFSPDWSVQLTSFRKPENAQAHWLEVSQAYPGLFEGFEKRIIRYDLGSGRGIYYRLRIGPFMDRAGADLKCLELQQAGLDCLVIWP
ncbi:MAG: SEL1-like repeat protein [Proteobacteria bacterium]|nr:SEL1-like repeat protein [Pseudomonadota bacterium]